MATEHRLIGFDIRFLTKNFIRDHWTKEARDRFLLVPSIPFWVSVDNTVWPSRFNLDLDVLPEGAAGEGDLIVKPGARARIDIGTELWVDLGQMIAHRAVLSQGRDFGIAVGIHPPSSVPSRGRLDRPGSDATVPPTPLDKWGDLGYDVADESLLSALFNFEVEPSERQSLRRSWGPRLNRYGLFDRAADALEFRTHCDARFPTHRPFYAFRLFLIWGNLEHPLT